VTRRLSWSVPESPPPKRPYRDTVIVYAVLAIVIVLVAWATGGGVGKALEIAAAFFVIAVAWSSYQWRIRLRRAAARQRDERSAADERQELL